MLTVTALLVNYITCKMSQRIMNVLPIYAVKFWYTLLHQTSKCKSVGGINIIPRIALGDEGTIKLIIFSRMLKRPT
jgi:hypothetical protein